MTRLTWRVRLLATCVVLAAIAFTQSPGLVAADTKLDLTQDPGAFLARSLHLWEDQAYFGQLQDQAYGYLFPVGPFFWLGHALHLEPWVVQRLWWWLLLGAAFLGVVRLTRLMGLASPSGRWVAGIAFALSPRVISTLGPISVETLPYVLVPWMLIPLASVRSSWSVRRAAALSGVAIVLMGGINATAAIVAGGLGLLWILTEMPRAVRVRMALAWTACAALATAWFVLPTLILGKYSPPFLDWIESSAVTTSITDGSAALRGVTDWVAYVAGGAGPQWPAGWSMVSERLTVTGTIVVSVTGVAGLALRRTQHRRFLLASLLIGLTVIVAAHVSAAGPWADGVTAGPLRVLLDGALSAFRNIHKFEVWLRLPLSIGFGWAVAALLERRGVAAVGPGATGAGAGAGRGRRPTWVGPGIVLGAVLVGLVTAALPALRGDLTVGRTFVSVPGYWLDTAAWLSSAPGRGRALVVPGAPFGTYLWGPSEDEPLQAYATSPWAVRSAVPLSSAGNIKALDEVEALMSDGRGDPHLAGFLSRMGVSYLVVRNDLDPAAANPPRPSLVHQTLMQSGGFSPVAAFGPLLSGYGAGNQVVDNGIDGAYRAVEIFRVTTTVTDPRIVVRDATSIEVMGGETDALLAMSGLPGEPDRPVVRVGDLPAGVTPGREVITDSGRRTEVGFGRVKDNRSRTLAPDDAWSLPRPVHDYLVTPAQPAPTLTYPGQITVTASSTRGDASSYLLDPAQGPWNGVDSDAATSWVPAASDTTNPWWQISRPSPMPTDGGYLVPWTDASVVNASVTLSVTTDRGTQQVQVRLPSGAVPIPIGLGPSSRVRVAVVSSDLPPGSGFGLAEVVLPGVDTSRTLVLPGVSTPGIPTALSLSVRHGSRSACIARTPTVCWSSLARSGEEDSALDRTVDTTGIVGDLHLTVVPRPGTALDRLLLPAAPAALARASSTSVPDPADRAQAALDGDPATTWVADPADRSPTLTVSLPGRVRVSWLRVLETPGAGASRPLVVTVGVGERHYPVLIDRNGYLRFPPTLTRTIELTITSTDAVLSFDSTTQRNVVLPVGISDLVLGEADYMRRPIDRASSVTGGCGSGPTVRVSGSSPVPTRLTTTVGAILDGTPATAVSCSPATLPSGSHRITVAPGADFAATALTWAAPEMAARVLPQPLATSWAATSRDVEVPVSDVRRTLELTENANAGWTATLDGAPLASLRVDGWRQAWILPPGAGGLVHLEFAPDRPYRAALLAGAGGVVLLLLLVALPVRRRRLWQETRPAPVRRSARLAVVVAVGFLSLGLVGTAAAVGAFVASGRRVTRPVLAGTGVLVATAAAALGPWPAATAWPSPVKVVVALLAAAGTGIVVGALLAPARSRSSRA